MDTIALHPGLLHAATEVEVTPGGLRPHRLPGWARRQFPDPQLLLMESQPSGVHLVVTTSARRLELDLHTSRIDYLGLPRPRGRVDVVVDGRDHASVELDGGDAHRVDMTSGAAELVPGAEQTITVSGLDGGHHRIEVWLPHNETAEIRGLRADAPLAPAAPAAAPWVHHGSSISHGSQAASPTGIWPVVAARRAGVPVHNLGLGGNALLDPLTARTIRDLPASVISLKIGINIVGGDVFRMRSLVPALHGFLDTIREGHPETPLLLVSPLHCALHEDTPGPGTIDPSSIGTGQPRFLATGTAGDTALGRLTLSTIRSAIHAVVEQRRADDRHLHGLDGLDLYGADDEAEHPLPDGLHPDPGTHRMIGERFAELVLIDGPLASARG